MHQLNLDQRVAVLGSKAIDGFSRCCLDGARRVLADGDNPLRLNLFSAAMRILFDHMMDVLAPKEAVVRTAWFKPEPDMDGSPTRGQRIIFAIQGGLTEDFVAQQLHIDPAPLRKRLLHAVNECSKQVHARANTIVVDQNEQDAMATASAQFGQYTDQVGRGNRVDSVGHREGVGTCVNDTERVKFQVVQCRAHRRR